MKKEKIIRKRNAKNVKNGTKNKKREKRLKVLNIFFSFPLPQSALKLEVVYGDEKRTRILWGEL